MDGEKSAAKVQRSDYLQLTGEKEIIKRQNVGQFVERVQTLISSLVNKHSIAVRNTCLALFVCLYFIYFGYALYHRFGDEGSIRLLWVTSVVVIGLGISFVAKYNLYRPIYRRCTPLFHFVEKYGDFINWIIVGIVSLVAVIYVLVDVLVIEKQPLKLVSAAGLIVFVVVLFLFSASPSQVNWRTVSWGLLLQMIMALIILKTVGGSEAVAWLGDRVTEFINYTDVGAEFVFGPTYREVFFAFKVMPVVIFFSSIVSVLYYLKVMQAVIRSIAWVMQLTMQTRAAESVNAAASTVVGLYEAPILIRPMLKSLTVSELHAVMTGGMASIAGSVMATYILFGISASHLLTASFMTAPAALSAAKLLYPETTQTLTEDKIEFEESTDKNIIAAASSGAVQSVPLIAGIIANIIAFLGIMSFINTTLTWFGNRVGVEKLTLQLISSYLLWPVALLMGVPVEECRTVAMLLGVRTAFSEYVAYIQLSSLIDNRRILQSYIASNSTWLYQGDDIRLTDSNVTLAGGIISVRSEVITTYALCGFSNISAMGIMLGSLGVMAPERNADLAKVVVRALVAANVACYISACIAGLLYTPNEIL